MLFDTPILFLIFNRPNEAQQVFNQIKKVKPRFLFIAADGPRDGNLQDIEKCTQARKILEQIDWNCELKILFREKNLGCGRGVSSAISWFFGQVEEGIILEDDCFPSDSFFYFCKKMLVEYRNNSQIFSICGSNFLHKPFQAQAGYYYSQHHIIWGWATWKRAWDRYDYSLSGWKDFLNRELVIQLMENYYHKNKVIIDRLTHDFDMFVEGKIDTWDFQWFYTCIINNAFSLIPTHNLISNIGIDGAHSVGSESKNHNIPFFNIDIDLIKKPEAFVSNFKLERAIFKHHNLWPLGSYKRGYKILRTVLSSVKRMVKRFEF